MAGWGRLATSEKVSEGNQPCLVLGLHCWRNWKPLLGFYIVSRSDHNLVMGKDDNPAVCKVTLGLGKWQVVWGKAWADGGEQE